MVIIKAAIMFTNGEVVEGHDYSLITAMANRLGFRGEHLNGFLTSSGEFVSSFEAASIALKAGQIHIPTKELSPEDLWPEHFE